jgi:hypothetical protein
MKKTVLCITLCIVLLMPAVVTAAAFPLPLPVQQESGELTEGDQEASDQEITETSADPAGVADPGDSNENQEQNYEDLLARKFSLDGESFQLPCPVKDFMAAGWQPNEDNAAGMFESITENVGSFWLYKGDSVLGTDIRPVRENQLAYVEGEVFSIKNALPKKLAPAPYTFPGNIALGASREDILNAYGDPHIIEYNNEGEAVLYHYVASLVDFGSNSANFSFNPKTDYTVNTIYLRQEAPNWPEEIIDGLDVEYPSDIEPYVAAKSPDSLEPLALQINDQTLTFPFPVAELLKEGWLIESCYESAPDLEPRTARDVCLRKGRSLLRVQVANISKQESVSFEACYVIGIELGQNSISLDNYTINDQCQLKIGGNLSLGMSLEDLADWISQDQVEIVMVSEFENSDHSITSNYKIEIGEIFVSIEVEGRQKTVCRISLLY